MTIARSLHRPNMNLNDADFRVSVSRNWPATSSDRGDPTNWDFTALTDDSELHDLDLSPIVPDGYRLVLLRFDGLCTTVPAQFLVRKKGMTETYNSSRYYARDTGSHGADLIVSCDVNRIVEYWASSGRWQELNLCVAAYWP
jgi:hypothetical protein